jgi:sugar phosphate isomerase/epimerase
VVLEVDTYWAVVGGVDPVALLGRLGERVAAIHIKDGPGNTDMKAQMPVGQGAIDIVGIRAAAKHADVGVIELDDYDGDVFDALMASLSYVRSITAA